MTTVIEEFVAKLGWDYNPKGLRTFEKNLSKLGSRVKKAAIALGGAAAAVGFFTVQQNKQTAALLNTAKAYDINATALENYSMLLGDIGVEGQSVANMMVSLGQKAASVVDKLPGGERSKKAFEALGLGAKQLANLGQQERFEVVLERLRTMEGQSKALALAEKLFGGDGVKVVGYIRQSGMSVKDLLKSVSDLNLQTEEGRAGALKFFGAWDDLSDSFQSFRALVAGVLGEALSPMLEQLKEWVISNKGLIQTKVKEWIKDVVADAKQLTAFMVGLANGVNLVAKAFGGWYNVFKLLIGLRVITWAKDLTAALAPLIGGRLFKGTAAVPAIAAVADKIEEVYNRVTGEFETRVTPGTPGSEGKRAKGPLFSNAILPIAVAFAATVYDAFKAFTKPEESTIVKGWQGLWDTAIEAAWGTEEQYKAAKKKLLEQGYDKATVEREFTYERYFNMRKSKFLGAMDDYASSILDKVGTFVEPASKAMDFAVGNIGSEIKKFAEQFATNAKIVVPIFSMVFDQIGTFFSNLATSVSTSIRGMMVSILSALKDLPFVGERVNAVLSMITTGPRPKVGPAPAPVTTTNGKQSTKGDYFSGAAYGGQSVTVNAPITVNAPAGTSPKAIAEAINQKLNSSMHSASQNAAPARRQR